MRAKDERRKVTQKEDELRTLVQTLSAVESERADMQAQLNRLNRYKEYLDATVDHADEGIEEIVDILNRLRTLEGANVDLMDQVNNNDNETDSVTNLLTTFVLETQNRVLVQNSRVHNHQNELETIRAEAKKGRDDEEEKQDRAKDASRETGQIVMAIRNLYARCCAGGRAKMPPFGGKAAAAGFEQLAGCLTFIEERIVDLDEVREGYVQEKERRGQEKERRGGGGGGGDSLPPIGKGGVKSEGSAFL